MTEPPRHPNEKDFWKCGGSSTDVAGGLEESVGRHSHRGGCDEVLMQEDERVSPGGWWPREWRRGHPRDMRRRRVKAGWSSVTRAELASCRHWKQRSEVNKHQVRRAAPI